MTARYLEAKPTRILLVCGALLIGLLHVPGFLQLARSPYTGIYTRNLTITTVSRDGPNADVDLVPGDQVTHLDGERLLNVSHYNYLLRAHPTLEPRTMHVSRKGRELVRTISALAQPKWILTRRVAVSFVGYSFLVVGLLVYLRRKDTLATLFLINCSLIAFLLTVRPTWGGPRIWILGEVVYDGLTLFLPMTFLHFFLVFPERTPHPRRLLGVRRKLYAVPVVLIFFTLTSVFLRIQGSRSYAAMAGLTMVLSTLYLVLFMVTALVVFVRSYFTARRALKERIRFVMFGVLLGVVPFCTTILLKQIVPTWEFHYEYLSLIFLSSISISFGYAILKHGVLDLRIVVRRSLVYTILSAFIIALYYSTVRWFGDLVAERFAVNQFVLTLFPAVVIAVLFVPLRYRIQNWVDRHFYSEEIRYRETLAEFTRELSRQMKPGDVLELLGRRLEETLHPRSVRLYARDEPDSPFVLSYDLIRDDLPPPPALAAASSLERYFGRRRQPLVVEFLADDWKTRRLDRTSRVFLEGNCASIVLPVVRHGMLMGLLSLGEKRSGKVYTEAEVELLETVVDHAAMAVENAQMHERAIRQESIRKELEVAREMQANLLPKTVPRYPGLDLHGTMESSTEVGGDFFDFRDFGRGQIGIAIGDVSGKGIPAALLMASLQVSFRGEAQLDRSPKDVMRALNQKLCQTGDETRFVTFFYGIVDLESRTFVYSNGGHPPPLLFHEPKRITRLHRGGLVLGVDGTSEYQEGVVKLPPKSVLVFYTDGIIEEVDPNGAFFGEEGIVGFYWNGGKKLPSAAIVDRLVRRVVDFGGSRQDDMTVLVARFT